MASRVGRPTKTEQQIAQSKARSSARIAAASRIAASYKGYLQRKPRQQKSSGMYMPPKSRAYAVSKIIGKTLSKQEALRYLNPFKNENLNDVITGEHSIGNMLPVVSTSNLEFGTSITASYTIVMLVHSNSGISYLTFTTSSIGLVTQVTYGNYTQLGTSPPDALRASRAGATLRNVTQNQNLAGEVKFLSLPNFVDLVWDGTGTMKLSAAGAKSIFDIMNNNPHVKSYTGNDLASEHTFLAAPASYVSFTNWNSYTVPPNLLSLEQLLISDSEKMAMTTLIWMFPPTTVQNNYSFKFSQQVACRYPSNTLLNNLQRQGKPVLSTAKFGEMTNVASQATKEGVKTE